MSDRGPDSRLQDLPGQEEFLQPRPNAGPIPPIRVQSTGSAALLFSGLNAQELLTRLSDGDPLRLYECCAVQVRERALFVDTDRLYTRTLNALVVTGEPPDRDAVWQWIDARIGDAVADILKEDEGCLRSQVPAPGEQPHMTVRALLGLDPRAALAVAVAFNSLELSTRRACVALFIEHRTVAECLEAGLGSLDELRSSASQGLAALTEHTPASRHDSASLGGRE